MTGRPSSYSNEIADRICEAIANGKSLRELPDMGLPGWSTIQGWLAKHKEFAAQYARAREAQADFMDDSILTEALGCTPENYMVARVRIDAYKWRASKLAPKVYGDKVQAEVSGPGGGPVAISWLPPEK